MGSAFKDGVYAGVSDLKSLNSDLGSASLGEDPDGFANLASLAGRGGFVDRMRSSFERIGENLHDDTKTWAEGLRDRLLDRCDAVRAQLDKLKEIAESGGRAASQLQDLGDPGDDEDKKSQAEAARENVKEGADEAGRQQGVAQNALLALHDELRSVNQAFKDRIAQAKSVVDAGQSPVDQIGNDIRALEEQILGKMNEQKSLVTQINSQLQTYKDLTAKTDDKLRAEKDTDARLLEGAKKDPPLAASELQSLEQAAASARAEREQAENEQNNYYQQTFLVTMQANLTKGQEWKPLEDQRSKLKQQRDQMIDNLNKSRTALADLNVEYQEPSL